MTNWRTQLIAFRDTFLPWTRRHWQRFRAWVRAQPRWRLALYGIGGPLAAGLLFLSLLSLLVWQGVLGPLPSYPELSNIRNDQASEIYAADGALLGKYYVENRTDADLTEISEHVIGALIATEDARFFEHSGIDLRAFGRVMVKSILMADRSSGGGSTLSQQLAKNLYPRRDYWMLGTLVNKVREMFTARRLENIYTKEELLGLYLNTVPFGENAFGIKVAAQRFFGKTPENLEPEEAAVLVGMLKGTSYYNPRRHPDRALERRNVVLAQMARYGKLDSTAVDSLQALPIELDFQAEGHHEGLATYFREHLRLEVLEILESHTKPDGRPYNLYTDGLKIYTTLDSRLQAHAEAAIKREMPEVQKQFNEDWHKRDPLRESTLERAIQQTERYESLREAGWSEQRILNSFSEPTPMTVFDWRGGAVDTILTPLDSLKHYLTLLNTGLLAVEPGTGLIKAWVGGIDHRFIQYDHVKAERQIGSTIKPIVYAAALQSGMLPCEYTPNELKRYEEFGGWTPHNSDGEYGGAYSLEGALAASINTIAVELALRAGLDRVTSLARQMGISNRVPRVPAVALGAVDASLWDMVTVYSTFANRGYRPSRLHYLDRIETAEGEVIVSFEQPKRSDFPMVLQPGHADMMLRLLQGVVDSGTAQRLRTVYGIGGPFYGKTGTTQDQRDGWFVGFNSRLVTGVWVGAEDPDIHFRTLYRGQSSRTALPVAGRFLRNVYRDRQLHEWRGGAYPEVPDTVRALMQCPPYLPEMPIVEDWQGEYFEVIAWSKAIQDIPSGQLDTLLRGKPRRENESLGEYAERIRRVYERRDRRDELREDLKEFWVDELFGGRKQEGG